jgi:hypothetical protein
MTALETTLPLHAREIFGFHATGAGLLFLSIIIPTLSAPLVGMAEIPPIPSKHER